MRNEEYWDPERRTVADRSEFRFYADEQASVFGLLGNEVDVLLQFSVAGGKALLTDPDIRTLELKASAHRQIHLRNDVEPFKDKRVRQAMALLVNRRALVDGLLDTKSDIGNDSPFAPVFPSTADVPQRQRDVRKAKELLAAAGMEDGFTVQLEHAGTGSRCPTWRSCCSRTCARPGSRIDLTITDAGTYYGEATFGNSPWLDSTMGITEYGHRGVPNVLLGAPLLSKGTWNGAHFKNDRYDALVKDYMAAVDLDVQRRHGEADPGAAARREPDPLHLLLLLPHRGEERGRRRRGHGDGPHRSQPHRAGGVAMGRFIGKRVVLSLITLFLLSVIVFVGSQVLPGDVGRNILGPFADQRVRRRAQRGARHQPLARHAVPRLDRRAC